jgi:hypothetical protein
VSTLYEREASAYHARLFVDEGSVVLVMQTGFTVFRPGETAREHDAPLGPVAVVSADSLIFWRAGALRQISFYGGDERDLAPLARSPQYLLASDSRPVWIHVDREAGSSLQTLSVEGIRTVDESPDRVCAAVVRDAVVYWILQSRDGSWRIGSVGLNGERGALTATHRGRPPAMLALGPDGVYFYDGPERGVRKLSFDLTREDTVSSNVVCSPLVVSNRTVCAHVGGLFDIPGVGAAPRFLASERAGPITSTAATDERVFWVAEKGDHHLVVRSVALSGL